MRIRYFLLATAVGAFYNTMPAQANRASDALEGWSYRLPAVSDLSTALQETRNEFTDFTDCLTMGKLRAPKAAAKVSGKDHNTFRGLSEEAANIEEKTQIMQAIAKLASVGVMSKANDDFIYGLLKNGIAYFAGKDTEAGRRGQVHTHLVFLAYDLMVRKMWGETENKIQSEIPQTQEFQSYQNINPDTSLESVMGYFHDLDGIKLGDLINAAKSKSTEVSKPSKAPAPTGGPAAPTLPTGILGAPTVPPAPGIPGAPPVPVAPPAPGIPGAPPAPSAPIPPTGRSVLHSPAPSVGGGVKPAAGPRPAVRATAALNSAKAAVAAANQARDALGAIRKDLETAGNNKIVTAIDAVIAMLKTVKEKMALVERADRDTKEAGVSDIAAAATATAAEDARIEVGSEIVALANAVVAVGKEVKDQSLGIKANLVQKILETGNAALAAGNAAIKGEVVKAPQPSERGVAGAKIPTGVPAGGLNPPRPPVPAGLVQLHQSVINQKQQQDRVADETWAVWGTNWGKKLVRDNKELRDGLVLYFNKGGNMDDLPKECRSFFTPNMIKELNEYHLEGGAIVSIRP